MIAFLVPFLMFRCICCVEYKIICISNCDTNSQIDASREIELLAECVEGCSKSDKFLWQLVKNPKRLRQSLDDYETLGRNTSFLTILSNVLRCGEVYDLELMITHKQGTKIYEMEMNMIKCSRNYRTREEGTSVQLDDYPDIDDVNVPAGVLDLSQTQLWDEIEEAKNFVTNKSETFVVTRKKVEILKMLELVEEDNVGIYEEGEESMVRKAIKEMLNLYRYGEGQHWSLARNVLAAGLNLLTKKSKEMRYPALQYMRFYGDTMKLMEVLKRGTNVYLDSLTDHRPKLYVPEHDFDPEQEDVDYAAYNDFDFIYNKRIKIVYDLPRLCLEIMKLFMKFQLGTSSRGSIDYKPILFGISATEQNLTELPIIQSFGFCIPDKLKQELLSEFNKTGAVFIIFRDDLFFERRDYIFHLTVYVGVGTQFEPYLLEDVTVPFALKMPHYEYPHPVEGNCRRPLNGTINDDCFGVHELSVELSMYAMAIDIKTGEKLKLVVIVGRKPTAADFTSNELIKYDNIKRSPVVVSIEALAGSKIYLAVTSNEENNLGGVLTYKVQVMRLQCDFLSSYYADPDSNSCKIHNAQDKYFYCNCTKLGLYKVFEVPIKNKFLPKETRVPQKIPFNYVPIVTLLSVILLFLLGMCCSRINKGKYFIIKNLKYLMDNNLSHEFAYILVVTSKSSTTANIAFQLHGSESSSQSHLFRGQSEPVLQSKANDWFYLLTEKDLGELQTIDIWSDCYGFKSPWFCTRIKVINPRTNTESIFKVNDWLTPIDNRISKTISVENPDEYYSDSFKNLSNHLWIKSFSNLDGQIFSFCERFNVLLSIFTINMMLTMLFLKFYHSGEDFRHFGVFELLVGCSSGFCTFIITSVLIYFFSNAAINSSDLLRFSCRWRTASSVFLGLTIITSCIVVIVFGLHTEFETSIVWIFTFLLGVLLCIILEGLRVKVFGYVTQNIDTKRFTIYYEAIEIQKDKVNRGLGINGMRTLLQKYYDKLTKEEIKEKAKIALNNKAFKDQKFEFITYIIYIIILFVIIIYNRDPLSNISANNIRDIFIEDSYIGKIKLNEINAQKRFYRYLNKVFLPAIHTNHWYGGFGSKAKGRLIDFNSKMIGVARIRQIRLQNGTCRLPKNLRIFVDECHSEYSYFLQDTQDYEEFWAPYKQEYENSQEEYTPDKTWKYQNWTKVKALPFVGELAVYPGAGYVMKFGRTWENSHIISEYIRRTRWIDQRTRAIFLDVNLYNINDNIFNFLTIAIEQSATGAFITNYQLHTIQFLSLGDIKSKILPFLWMSLTIFIILFSWTKCLQIKQTRFWNVVDLLIIVLLVILLVTFGVKQIIIDNTLKEMKLYKNDYMSYYEIIVCHKAIEVITAILITFSTIRLWKLLQFLRQFQLFELTLIFSWKYLLSMMVMNALLILVYATVGFLLLGPYVKKFRTVWSSFVALMLISFGLEFNMGLDTNHQTMYSYLGYIYFAGYLILVLVLLNIFITIIVVGYNNAKEYLNTQIPKTSILDYLKNECSYNRCKYKGRIRNVNICKEADNALERLRAGQDLIPKPDARSDKIFGNQQSMLEMHQLTDKAMTLIQEKYKYDRNERKEHVLKVLGHYYYKFSNENPPETANYEEYLVVTDKDQTFYCSKKRQKDIGVIVNHLMTRQGKKVPQSIEDMKQKIEKQLDDVKNMSEKIDDLIGKVEQLLWEGCPTKSTQLNLEDLGLELDVDTTSSFSSSIDEEETSENSVSSGNLEIIVKL